MKGCDRELGYRHEGGAKAYCGEEAFGGMDVGLINIYCDRCKKKVAKKQDGEK